MLWIATLTLALQSLAHQHKSFYVGIEYFSENSLGRITQTSSGAKSGLMGTTSTPIKLKYDFQIGSETYLTPTLSYLLFERKVSGDTGKASFLHLTFPIGKNLSSSNFEWSAGPGLLRRTIKGAGGTMQLNNGSSYATFAVPGANVTSTVATLNFNVAYNMDRSRFGFDFITEGFMSDKRTFHLGINYIYDFSEGLF